MWLLWFYQHEFGIYTSSHDWSKKQLRKVFQPGANKSFRSYHMDHFIPLPLSIAISNVCIPPSNIVCVVQCPLQNPTSRISAKTEESFMK